MRSGGTIWSRAAMLRADRRAGLVVTRDTACGRVEQSGRELRCCMQTGGLVGSRLATLHVIGWNGQVAPRNRRGMGCVQSG